MSFAFAVLPASDPLIRQSGVVVAAWIAVHRRRVVHVDTVVDVA